MHQLRVPVALAAIALFPASALAQDTPTLSVQESAEYGQYIVGPQDRPVYLFTTDTRGDGEDPVLSCTSQECLEAWPLVTAEGEVRVGPGLDAALAGTFAHEGRTVVTYNGWPLYTFVRDEAGQPPRGQDIHSFGGEWYLVGPDGEQVEDEGE